MIVIDYKDTRPIYEQIVDRFQNLVLKGILPPDSKMPSVRSLAMELSINPNTIQKAYDRLEQNGFIYTVKGRGSFVAQNEILLTYKKQELLSSITALALEAYELGLPEEALTQAVRRPASTIKKTDVTNQTGGDAE